ncbi:MAG: alpha-L-rhamnosidase C-terminal domain-containing protein [Chthoniobacterales bacterium]
MSATRIILSPVGHLVDANHVTRHPAEKGAWIWHPDLGPKETAVLRFRLRFQLQEAVNPVIHVTGDQRFQLRCDGHDVTFGPDRCDLEHWSVQSLRLELAAGEHELEALVWYIKEEDHDLEKNGPDAVRPPMAQVSYRSGFLLYSDEAVPELLNTGTAAWEVEDLTAAVSMRRPALRGYHDIGPEFSFALETWQSGVACSPKIVCPPLTGTSGVRRPGWCLYPAVLPEQNREKWTGGKIRALRGGWTDEPWEENAGDAAARTEWQALIDGAGTVNVPPQTETSLIWDFESYRCGYPEMRLSGGADAEICWDWAEAFYSEPNVEAITSISAKGNRNEINGKVFLGTEDKWRVCRGAKNLEIPALWWRCGRFLRIRIRTRDEALTVSKMGILVTGYPLGDAAIWKSSDAEWDALAALFRQAFRQGAHETWTDSPYYEQMCYVGDTALTCLSNYVLFPNDGLSRRAIQMFDWSRRASGFVAERYPCGWRQESLTYALLWPGMVRDYAWWRNDAAFVRERLPGIRSLLVETEALVGEDGLLHKLPGWSFVDWVPEWKNGCGPGVEDGDSSIINFHWIFALQAAAAVEEFCGDKRLAERDRDMARVIFDKLVERYWDAKRGIFLDTVNCADASEHAQMFALLTGLLDAEKSATCLAALCGGEKLARATIYASFYVLEALARHGAHEVFHQRMKEWKELLDFGFTSTPEAPEPTRSDCHAWGAHPAWHLAANVAGVQPTDFGFSKLRVQPCPGELESITCEVMHPAGVVRVELEFSNGRVRGKIDLPQGVEGAFIWPGQNSELHAGENRLS